MKEYRQAAAKYAWKTNWGTRVFLLNIAATERREFQRKKLLKII